MVKDPPRRLDISQARVVTKSNRWGKLGNYQLPEVSGNPMPTIKIDQNLEADDRRLIDLAQQLGPEHRAIVLKFAQDLLMLDQPAGLEPPEFEFSGQSLH